MNRTQILPIAVAALSAALGLATALTGFAVGETYTATRGEISVTQMTTSTLKVPGATIYYEVRGSGPTLLIIPGGPQDAGVFSDIAARLAAQYTVVTYDPRGNSRSPFDGEAVALDVDVQADDAAALIGAVGAPAYVFGTSGGAQIALNLAARHPEVVKAVLAHEPPSYMLLDDPSEALAADKLIHDTYLSAGVDAAMGAFFGMNGLEDEAPADAPPAFEPSPEEAETFARVSGNFEYWLAHGMMPLGRYRPDVDTLKQGEPVIIVAIGEKSAGQPIEAMAAALAEQLGTDPVSFPGDHMGFGPEAEAFTAAMHYAFDGR
ncbi:alpha/beta fold hydrolase [Devosia sp. CN2-171]|uniref:alpha/beta fold hydrolase n=1 Tax=Devosia sp. CN2-171 TaxID=3400909 RepID=UPI003BF8052B